MTVMMVIRSVWNTLFKIAEIMAKKDMTKNKGDQHGKGVAHRGRNAVSHVDLQLLMPVTKINNSVAARPMRIPANIAWVPVLLKARTPETDTPSLAPSGITVTDPGIMMIRVASDTRAAAMGFS